MPRSPLSEGGTIQEGSRFETALSPNHQMATLQERGNPSVMFGPMRLPAVFELRELVDRLRLGLEPHQGRFKAVGYDAIADTQIYRKISKISDRDLAEMLILLDSLLERMDTE